MSIFKKLTLLIVATVLCLVISLSYTAFKLVSDSGNASALQQLEIFSTSMQAEIDRGLCIQNGIANLIIHREDLPAAIAANDQHSVKLIAKELLKGPEVNLVTICDSNGKVIARGHSDKAGDTLGASRISATLPLKEGKTVVGIEPGNEVPLTLATGIPLNHEGKRIGAIIIGQALSSGEFVDGIKAKFGVESTVFIKDTRVATSVRRDGKPFINTKLNNLGISDVVLKKGERVITRNMIGGTEYDTIYWPWRDMTGNIAGMFFVGLTRASIEKAQNSVVTAFILIGGIVGLIMTGSGVYFAKTLCTPLRTATHYAETVAAGNLDSTLTIQSKDEVGVLASALQSMVATLKQKILESDQKSFEAGEQAKRATIAMTEAQISQDKAEAGRMAILQAAESVELVVANLSQSAQNLTSQIKSSSQSAKEQQMRVTGAVAAMEEMNATVQEVARNASVASDGSDQAKNKALEGNSVVHESVKAIQSVQNETQSLRNSMDGLGVQAESIGSVMTVISDIADQTNLLALNAAIEAARAGEAGRGFAVVADEVRKLAEKTMTATREVGEVITGIQQGTKSSIEAVDRTSNNLVEATELVDKSGSSLSEIVKESTLTADQVRNIATAAEEQSATSEEIAHSLEDIDRLATTTASIMQESAQAVAVLSNQIQILEGLVHDLRKDG